jgi:solute carrier family 25, member 34/35
LFSWHP